MDEPVESVPDVASDVADGPRILLTNDDGVDAPGLAALYEELTAVGTVTVVAPLENQSGVGRTRSHRARREDHPWGVAIDGTPADCVAYGVGGLDREFDLVVSGCNHGPNAGNYVVGRSGTVGACIEAAFLGVPAMAVSAYHCEDFFLEPADAYDFGRPARVARELAVRALSADVFAAADVLNVNVPVDVADPTMRVTDLRHDYDVRVEHAPDDGAAPTHRDAERVDPDGDATHRDEGSTDSDGDASNDVPEEVALRDAVWPDTVGWENPFPAHDGHRERYPVGTDRRALVDGDVSVTPLTAPSSVADAPALEAVADGFNESARRREAERGGAAGPGAAGDS